MSIFQKFSNGWGIAELLTQDFQSSTSRLFQLKPRRGTLLGRFVTCCKLNCSHVQCHGASYQLTISMEICMQPTAGTSDVMMFIVSTVLV